MFRARQVGFVIFVGLVPRFAMYRGQIDDQVRLLRQRHCIERQPHIAGNVQNTRQAPIG